MDAETRHRMLQMVGVSGLSFVRRFDPALHPHSPDDGKFVETLGDALKLAGKIDLDPGEELVGSDKVSSNFGQVRMALTRRNGKSFLRIGLGNGDFGTRDDDAGPWRGGPGKVAEINAENQRLRDERDRLNQEYDDLIESGADPERLEVISRRIDEIDDTGPGEVTESGYTARLDGPAVERLRAELSDAIEKGARVIAASDAQYDEIERLEVQAKDADFHARRDPLVEKYNVALAGGPPISPEDDAELDRLTDIWVGRRDRIDKLKAEADATDLYRPSLTEGSVPGEWGDVHYQVYVDDAELIFLIAAVPHGSTDDPFGNETDASLREAEARKLLQQLALVTSG